MLSTHPGEHGTLIIRSSQLRRGMVGAVEDRTTTPVLPAHLPFEHTHMHGSRHNDEQPFSERWRTPLQPRPGRHTPTELQSLYPFR